MFLRMFSRNVLKCARGWVVGNLLSPCAWGAGLPHTPEQGSLGQGQVHKRSKASDQDDKANTWDEPDRLTDVGKEHLRHTQPGSLASVLW